MSIIPDDKRCVTLLHTYATSSTPRCDVYYMGLTYLQYNILQEQLQEQQSIGEWLFDLFPEARVKGNVPVTIHLEHKSYDAHRDRHVADIVLGLSKSTRVVLWDSLDGMNTFATDDPAELESLMFTLYTRWKAQKAQAYVAERLAWIHTIEDSTKQAVAAVRECYTQGTVPKEVYSLTVNGVVKAHPIAKRFAPCQLDSIANGIVRNTDSNFSWNSEYTRVSVVTISNIEWDVDDETEAEDLPTELVATTLTVPYDMPMYSVEYEELLTDMLSSVYGYCTKGYTYEATKYASSKTPYCEKTDK